MDPLEALSLSQLVTDNPRRILFFEQYGIDYCCGGGSTLSESVCKKKLSLEKILTALKDFDKDNSYQSPDENCSEMSISELVDHIYTRHHQYLYHQFPCLDQLFQKIISVHGENHPLIIDLKNTYNTLRGELLTHLFKEENVLFPYCKAMDTSETLPEIHCGHISNPIQVMKREHEDAGKCLETIQKLIEKIHIKPELCSTYPLLVAAMKELIRDLHLHIHKENNILFPLVLEKSSSLPLRSTRCSSS